MSAADRESFTRWASHRQLALFRTALLVSGDHHRAEDLVQEALTQVALRWSRLADGHPEAYARQVIVRRNISWWRKHRREVVADVPEHGLTTTGAERGADRRMALDAALARLTARQRAVIVLRFYEDLPERETAETLGVSTGTVKSQTHLALRRLREGSPHLAEMLEDLR
ncbi:SigE family RNA polymerase sigma factor [Nocardioides panaciterrulae]|uniref:RNA polymerase sigma-70 factor (Sigma-E family) n=1 Tax=Nocardioides panaciterrulae TaxID=661492 RepID=A0A7Y9E446_9ACTN|nr:RNA polymerase sigma-70 factor (sigma-E family) [Nocardioides panaciterrulae]